MTAKDIIWLSCIIHNTARIEPVVILLLYKISNLGSYTKIHILCARPRYYDEPNCSLPKLLTPVNPWTASNLSILHHTFIYYYMYPHAYSLDTYIFKILQSFRHINSGMDYAIVVMSPRKELKDSGDDIKQG